MPLYGPYPEPDYKTNPNAGEEKVLRALRKQCQDYALITVTLRQAKGLNRPEVWIDHRTNYFPLAMAGSLPRV